MKKIFILFFVILIFTTCHAQWTGDNLGNHKATKNLNMGSYNINNPALVDGVDVSALQTATATLKAYIDSVALSTGDISCNILTDTGTMCLNYSGALEISSLTATGTGVFAYIGSTINITGIRAFITHFSATKIELDFHLVTDSTTHTTIFVTQGNRPTIAASANEGAEAVPDTTAIPKDSRLALHIDNTDGVAKDLMIWIKYWKLRGQ